MDDGRSRPPAATPPSSATGSSSSSSSSSTSSHTPARPKSSSKAPPVPDPWMSFATFVKTTPHVAEILTAPPPVATSTIDSVAGYFTDLWTEYSAGYDAKPKVSVHAQEAELITLASFEAYLKRVRHLHAQFRQLVEDYRRIKHHKDADEEENRFGAVGLGTVADLVPREYFSKDYSVKSEKTIQTLLHTSADVLGYYLDQVEVVLSKQVSLRFHEFYSAVALFRELLAIVRDIAARVASIRALLHNMQDQFVQDLRKVLILKRRKENMEKILQKTKKIAAVSEACKTAEYLFAHHDYASALGMIEEALRVIRDDLPRVSIGRVFLSNLRVLRQHIYSAIEDDYVRAFASMAESDDEPPNNELMVVLLTNEAEFENMVTKVFNMHLDSLQRALEGSPPIQSWDHFQSVLDSVLSFILKRLSRLLAVSAAIRAAEDSRFVQKASVDACLKMVQTSYAGVASFLAKRSEANSKIQLTQWLRLISTLDAFYAQVSSTLTPAGVLEAQLLSARQVIANVLQAQMRAFLDTFHSKRLADIMLLAENEQWKPTDIPSEFRNIADIFDTSSTTTAEPSVESGAPQTEKRLVFAGEERPMTSVSLMLLKMIREYCEVIQKFSPVIQIDAVTKLGELLRTFNTRTCAMILGTGAMAAGLKAISVRHIALLAENLSFFVDLIPRLVAYLRGMLGAKESLFLREIESVVKDLVEHRKELLRKVVSIMRGMIDSQLQHLDAASIAIEGSDANVSQWMQQVVRETHKLHRVIVSIMTKSYVHILMSTIVQLYAKKLSEAYGKVLAMLDEEQSVEVAKRSIFRDVGYLKSEAATWGAFEEDEWRPLDPFLS